MAKTGLYLDMRGKAKDGKGSVLITIYHNETTTTISTGVRVAPNHWRNDRVVNVPGDEAINAYLSGKLTDIEKAIALLSLDKRYKSMTASQIRNSIVKKDNINPSDKLVSSVFREYMTQDLRENTKALYRMTLNKVLAFGGETMRIDSIDIKWVTKFESYLAKTQGVNGRAIHLRNLRAICNYAKKMRLISDYPFEDFSIRQEPTKKRNIPVAKLRKLLTWPLPDDKARYRDYFFLMFYLIGINSIDLLSAKKSDVVDGRLEYIRHKTGKRYSVKLEPEALEIIDRYKGKDWLLDAMDNVKLYTSFARKINETLREIGDEKIELVYDQDDLFAEPVPVKKIRPLIPGITTYYARHSWGTIAKSIGIPIDVIAQALGHSPGNKTTLIYVEFDQRLVDDANRKVIDYLLCLDKPALRVP